MAFSAYFEWIDINLLHEALDINLQQEQAHRSFLLGRYIEVSMQAYTAAATWLTRLQLPFNKIILGYDHT
jgi:hypothetical protein